jgi:hypothetical protein
MICLKMIIMTCLEKDVFQTRIITMAGGIPTGGSGDANAKLTNGDGAG